jgi:hypothetical protein
MVRDISQRKWVETEREKLIHELEEKNAESETLRESTAIVVETLDETKAVGLILEQLEKVIPLQQCLGPVVEWGYAGNCQHTGLEPPEEHIGMKFKVNENEPSYPLLTGASPYVLFDDVQLSSRIPKQ